MHLPWKVGSQLRPSRGSLSAFSKNVRKRLGLLENPYTVPFTFCAHPIAGTVARNFVWCAHAEARFETPYLHILKDSNPSWEKKTKQAISLYLYI